MQVEQPGWHVAQFQIGFCLANHGPAALLTFTMQNHPSDLGQIGTSIEKVTEPNVQFLGAHGPQAPELLRQGVPQRDSTLGQVTLATHWPVNALMEVDQPSWPLPNANLVSAWPTKDLHPC